MLSLEGSPPESKSISGSGYSGVGNSGYSSQHQYLMASTSGGSGSNVATSSAWYGSAEGNIHVLHNGEVLRKVEPGTWAHKIQTFN